MALKFVKKLPNFIKIKNTLARIKKKPISLQKHCTLFINSLNVKFKLQYLA